MRRPDPEDYPAKPGDAYFLNQYMNAMEEYCDYLENLLSAIGDLARRDLPSTA